MKVLVLGNGRIGKTQICRRLRGEGYDPGESSTHGIVVTVAPLGVAGGEEARAVAVRQAAHAADQGAARSGADLRQLLRG